LLPLENLMLRRALDQWFDQQGLEPRIVGEFEDSALLKVFGGDGLGLFPAPTVVENEVMAQYGVQLLGRVEEVRERFYAISVERRLKNPAIVAISDAARHELFASPRASR
jgi:LysR family transcriptional activator of nhaA